jgi:hypothetical protein
MASDPLSEALQSFRYSATKLETRQDYAVGEEKERLRAFREHRARPERSVRTTPYLQWVARAVLDGKSWVRARIVEYPLTDYTRYQLVGYQESAAAGEQIYIADRARSRRLEAVRQDGWLFDEGYPGERALLLDYGPGSEYLGSREATPGELQRFKEDSMAVLAVAVPLNEYMAEREREAVEAA